MQRETLGSRIGFILISAGCAIGLGNVWRFPYIVGEYGGAAFILIYLAFLVLFGLPIMTMEFSVGRASRQSIMGSFKVLEPRGTKWHLFGGIGMAGNYLLVMFYTVVTGWMFAYFFKMLRGDFVSLDPAGVSAEFSALTSSPVRVLVEERKGKYLFGHSEHFAEIYFEGDDSIIEREVRLVLDSTDGNSCFGTLC